SPPFPRGRIKEGVGSHAIDEKEFFAVLKKGFAHPRKLLASNVGIHKETLAQCGIPEKARPENLSIQDWLCLAQAVNMAR
ncbi:MAG: hypothetical protein Q7R88_00965, partial [bacterium]|nr:hypothetical protein [bacterium]